MPSYPIANACDWQQNLYLMWAGQQAPTQVYVWADALDSAFDTFVEWLDDQGLCGFFVDVTIDDLKDTAKNLGISWDPDWPDWSDPDFEKVGQEAEIDLTIISHTTLNCGQYIPSYEWGGNDVMGNDEIDEVRLASQIECYGHDYQKEEKVFWTDPDNLGTGWYTISTIDQETIDLESPQGSWGTIPIDEISREGPPEVDVSTFEFD